MTSTTAFSYIAKQQFVLFISVGAYTNNVVVLSKVQMDILKTFKYAEKEYTSVF